TDGGGSETIYSAFARRIVSRLRLRSTFLSLGPPAANRIIQKLWLAFSFSSDRFRAFSSRAAPVLRLYLPFGCFVFPIFQQSFRSSVAAIESSGARRRHRLVWRAIHVRRCTQLVLFCRSADVVVPNLRVTAFFKLCLDTG